MNNDEPMVALWYKRPYSGADYTELKRNPAYYILEDNGKDGLMAFRVVGKASENSVPCTPHESLDLEAQRLRRQGLHE